MGKCKMSTSWLRGKVRSAEQRGVGRHMDKVLRKNKDKTRADKIRDWNKLQEVKEKKGVECYSEDDFLDAMEAMVELGYHASRFEKYRAAVVDQQLMGLAVEKRWTQDMAFKKRFGAIKKQAMTVYMRMKTAGAKKKGNKPLEEDGDVDDGLRGAIVEAMGIQLIKWLRKKGLGHYADGVMIAHAGLLRHGEIMEAAHKDFYIENGVWHVKIAGGKWREEGEVDYVPLEDARLTLDRVIKKGVSGKLFPVWDPEEIRAEIRECARAHGWDANRRWDFHCLRHGKAVDNRLKGMSLQERMMRGRWKSEKTEKHYSRHR